MRSAITSDMQIEGVQRPSIRSNARFGPSLLLDQLDGILNHCRTPVRFGVVEAINGNIKALLRRGRGYTDLRYLLLKAQRLAAMKTEFLVLRKVA
jgi:transposase